MCGINGIISRNKLTSIEERIGRMNNSIAHRGPDADQFITRKDRIALGHRRLSILDLDPRSNQPMRLDGGKYIIVFNGEIFNFNEIAEQLKEYHTFQTSCDTEVLLAALEYKGVEWALQQANGFFAFAAYNTFEDTTIIARDRFGIKPLYYTIQHDSFIFSSEIKGILNSGLFNPAFNNFAIDDYLAMRYVREPYTFFKDIYQVRSSTYLVLKSDLTFTEHKYWSLPALNFEENFDEEKVVKETEAELLKAFHRWFVSDVPVGSYLSGGVDSSLTTAILKNYSDQKISTYTIGFEDEKYNEFRYAKVVADQYKTDHHVLLCSSANYFADWVRLIRFKDAPIAVPNEIPLAQMSSALKQDMTVVISGEGADELFGGYGRIFRSAFDYSNDSKGYGSFYDYFISKYDYVPRTLRDKYLSFDCKSHREKEDEIIRTDFEKHRNEENIFRFFHSYHIQGLLQRVDMTTMQTSVEARPPFLDHELVEYVYTKVPYSLKLKWNDEDAKQQATAMTSNSYSETLDTPKYILKKISENYIPKELIYRKKMGFPVPLTEWFPELQERAKVVLKDAKWLNQEELNSLISEIKENDRAGQILWMFMNVQLFYNQYFDRNWKW